MKTITPVFQRTMQMAERQSDAAERLVVWSVWFTMFIFTIYCIIKYGRDIPLAEDWLLVAPLTGNEPDIAGWLWAQNNEHRVPVPKLIFLALLKLTKGDFRAGMYFNAIILGGVSMAMLQLVRQVRGGKTKLTDAFFPIILLHIGQWENLVWSWQLSFVFPVALIFGVLVVFVTSPMLTTWTSAVYSAIALILLPLCGGIGLLFVPFLALWLTCCGVLHWKAIFIEKASKNICILLIGSATVALIIVGVYFIGYERPTWNPPSPNIKATLETAAKFVALGLGPAAAKSWKLSILLSFVILLPTVWIAVRGVLQHKGREQFRAFMLLLFSGNLALFALAIGWGRAGLVPTVGLPIRYVLLAVPIFCVAFFIWELYGPKYIRTITQWTLVLIMALLIPYNTMMGFGWRNWYLTGMEAIEKDLSKQTQLSVLASQHRDFLIHWWDEKTLTEHIQMLSKQKIGPFTQIQNDLATSEDSDIK